ncbi:MAG: methionine synthase [Bacteroidaceae bacterium]|nr:methionine synthase [Bacteroidaceae bacterium]
MEQTFKDIREQLAQRILILDGAMGTRIQAFGLSPESFHRGRFASWPVSLVGNNDVLCLTEPDVIKQIHRLYIEAGADIIATNTFSSNRISQHEYGCSDIAAEMAREGARLARQVADRPTPNPSLEGRGEVTSSDSFISGKTINSSPYKGEVGRGSGRKIYVAGSMGPTSKSLTLPSDMGEPAKRAISFDEMADSYREQAEALLEGGADFLLLETCYDALNTKAALYAINDINARFHREIPVMVSVTINDRSGRTLTGQTLWAFYTSVSHYPYLLSFGLNCSFGVTDLRPFMEQLSANVPLPISIYPNAGLPNQMGEYEELPDFTASHLRKMAEAGLINIAGGCCGTDEQHIRAIADALRDIKPRTIPAADNKLRVSGLEPLLIDRETQNFTNVGERTNVAGSRKFARLIAEKQYGEALSVARNQIEGGATVIDINMDDAMLDSQLEMQTFCRHISGEPAVGKAVLMIDSSDWPTVLAGLKNAQGKCIVNSISLKAGEQDFLGKALELRRLGAAVVVMAFDEEGQATTYERKIAIARRAYNLLTSIGFPPQDIIFDVNILSVGTGIKEHQAYAVDFIRAVEWIKQNLPFAKTSGGVSNLSFAFRGNNRVREAMHSVFLYYAIRAGLDMVIVNPSMLQIYDEIDENLRRAVEDVIMNTDDEATDRLLALSEELKNEASTDKTLAPCSMPLAPDLPIEQRLQLALTKGDSSHLVEDVPEALAKYGQPIKVIEGPLMQAMEHIGVLFGEGKMFLPQVVRSAQVMKDAVAILQPYIDASDKATGGSLKPCVVLATANGDVHDIGKNIVGIVLACNGFEVVDLGVMVPCETILEATKEHKPVLVGISGLITPSLKEMEKLCQTFQEEHLDVPILVGGATTSAVHTAVKLAPLYDGLVIYGGDASQTSVLAKRLTSKKTDFIEQIRAEQTQIRDAYNEYHAPLTPYEEANKKSPLPAPPLGECPIAADNSSIKEINFQLQQKDCDDGALLQRGSGEGASLLSLIDWRMFLLFWGFKGETLPQLLVNPEAEKTLKKGKQFLESLLQKSLLEVKALYKEEAATRRGNDIVLCADGQTLPMLRSQSAAYHYRCLADYFDEQQPSPIGLFLVTARPLFEPKDEEERLMTHALCARLAEAAAEMTPSISSIGEKQESEGIRPLRVAFGYATCPDHSLKRIVFDRLEAEQKLNVTLTDRYSIQPSTSVCGLILWHPEAKYFPVGRIDREQLRDYCQRRGISVEEGESLLSKYIAKGQ